MESRGGRVRIIRMSEASRLVRMSRVDRRGRSRLDVAHAAAAGGEEDEVLGEDGGAVVPAAATAESLPGADNATLDVLAEGHAREMGKQVSYRDGRGKMVASADAPRGLLGREHDRHFCCEG